MNFLDTVTTQDLKMFDKPIWQRGARYEFVVKDVNEVIKEKPDGTKNTVLMVKTKTLTGPNEGRANTFFVNSAVKSQYVGMLIALFGKDAIEKKTAKLSNAVGTVLAASVGDVVTFGTKEFQNWYGYENKGQADKSLIDSTDTDEPTTDIPF